MCEHKWFTTSISFTPWSSDGREFFRHHDRDGMRLTARFCVKCRQKHASVIAVRGSHQVAIHPIIMRV